MLALTARCFGRGPGTQQGGAPPSPPPLIPQMPRTDYVPRQTTTLLRVLGIVSLFFPDVLMALHPRAPANVILSSRLPVVSPKNKQSEHAHVLTLTPAKAEPSVCSATWGQSQGLQT